MGSLSTQTSETSRLFWKKKFKIQSEVKILSFRSLASDRMDMQFSLILNYNSMLFLPLCPTCYIKALDSHLHQWTPCHIGGRAVIPLHSTEKWPHLGYMALWGCCSYHYYYIFLKCSLCARLYSQYFACLLLFRSYHNSMWMTITVSTAQWRNQNSVSEDERRSC